MFKHTAISRHLVRHLPLLFLAFWVNLHSGAGVIAAEQSGESIVAKEQVRALTASLIGIWKAEFGKAEMTLTLAPDGKFALNDRQGEYSIRGKTLVLRTPEVEAAYVFELSGDTLTLSGADLSQSVKFLVQPLGAGVLNGIFDVTPGSVALKTQRIGFILLVVLACTFLIVALRRVSRLVVYSEWGFLRYVYRNHKSRIMTIHSIILNLVKYVVYFTGFGFVLTELGINYTAYLASLSVVGLAVAFGSQGLVQDVVTGFFIIFESQFDVGDMVEISGQTGIVEELGLRMTKLRNYAGEIMIIPNRNIAVVGNYEKGALHAQIDVAITATEAVQVSSDILKNAGVEIAHQFCGVFLQEPVLAEPFLLETGERFLRLSCDIWPAQQWVVDQQVIPRIREQFAANGITILSDRVTATYHRQGKKTP